MPVPPASPAYTALFQASDVMALARTHLNDADGVSFTDSVLQPAVGAAYRGLQRELYVRGKVGGTYTFADIAIPVGVTVIGDAVDTVDIDDITRAANVVTVNTAAPHGLLTGMGVVIAGNVDASFNGQFVVTVVSATRFTFAQVAANGGNAASGTVTISPTLPTDFAFLEALKERGATTSEGFTEVEEATDYLPDYPATQQLRYYNQGSGEISFIGATRAITLRMKYSKLLADLENSTDYVRLRGSLDALAYMTAAIVTRGRGTGANGMTFTALANREIENLIAMYVKPKSRRPARRHPYGHRRRALYL